MTTISKSTHDAEIAAAVQRDREIEHDRNIDRARQDLADALGDAEHGLARATKHLRELSESDLFDIEIVEGRTGTDIGVFLDDARRATNAARALVAGLPR